MVAPTSQWPSWPGAETTPVDTPVDTALVANQIAVHLLELLKRGDCNLVECGNIVCMDIISFKVTQT